LILSSLEKGEKLVRLAVSWLWPCIALRFDIYALSEKIITHFHQLDVAALECDICPY
jgi:hypothetical protein